MTKYSPRRTAVFMSLTEQHGCVVVEQQYPEARRLEARVHQQEIDREQQEAYWTPDQES